MEQAFRGEVETDSRLVFSSLFDYLEKQSFPGGLHSLLRAVLAKGLTALEQEGHWPILDLPLTIHRSLNGLPEVGISLGGCCVLFYAFSDVIDDAQDHDLAVEPWEKWGWEQAVNTGTNLLFQSLKYLHDSLPGGIADSLVRILVTSGLEMTAGQHLDLQGHQVSGGYGDYLGLIERKSGASLGAYVELVARANEVNQDRLLTYRNFGRSVGILFQMLNDTHELWNGEISPDYVNRRLSLPICLALEQLSGNDRVDLLFLLEGSRDISQQYKLVSLLERTGIKAYAQVRVEAARRRAIDLAREIGLASEPYVSRVLSISAFPDSRILI